MSAVAADSPVAANAAAAATKTKKVAVYQKIVIDLARLSRRIVFSTKNIKK